MKTHVYTLLSMVLCLWLARPGQCGGATPAPRGEAKSKEGTSMALGKLDWLVGHWRGSDEDALFEEIWSGPLGGSMMGMFRLVSGGTVKFYELIVIETPPAGPVMRIKHFSPGLEGWEERREAVTMPLKSTGREEARFETSDGKERLIYRKPGPDALLIRLEKVKNGKQVSAEFHLRK